MISKKAQEMKHALHKSLMGYDVESLYDIYNEINSWDGSFLECGIERYTIEDIEDIGLLLSLVNDLKYHSCDDNPLQYDYFSVDNCGEWVVWNHEKLYNTVDELTDYLIDQAGYSGFPTDSLYGKTIEFEEYEISDIERFCKIIQDHI